MGKLHVSFFKFGSYARKRVRPFLYLFIRIKMNAYVLFHQLISYLYRWYNPKTGNLWDQMSNTLMKADYHGALLKVASSKCITLNGLQGIVIFDTKYTFTVISKDDTCRSELFLIYFYFILRQIQV